MTRQSSETGRHLLSEPETPLSPPAHRDALVPMEGKDAHNYAQVHTNSYNSQQWPFNTHHHNTDKAESS